MRIPKLLPAALTCTYIVLRAATATACMNAVVSEEETVAKVQAAERALERQDFAKAEDLSTHAIPYAQGGLQKRALRVHALATLRDPAETDIGAKRNARTALEQLARESPGDVTLEVDAAEAQAYFPDGEARAYGTLSRLARADLVGSPFAYAALGRLAREGGHGAESAQAVERCERMAVQPSICRGAAPRAPLFRGAPGTYAAAAIVLAMAIVLGLLRARRTRAFVAAGVRPLGALHRAAVLAPFGAAAALTAHVAPLAIAIAAAGVLADRLACRAVLARRARALPRTVTRPYDVESEADRGLPALGVWPFEGARPLVIEQSPDEASYRQGARTAILRLGLLPRERGPIAGRSNRATALALACCLGVVVAAVAGFTLTLTARSSRAPAPVSVQPEEGPTLVPRDPVRR